MPKRKSKTMTASSSVHNGGDGSGKRPKKSTNKNSNKHNNLLLSDDDNNHKTTQPSQSITDRVTVLEQKLLFQEEESSSSTTTLSVVDNKTMNKNNSKTNATMTMATSFSKKAWQAPQLLGIHRDNNMFTTVETWWMVDVPAAQSGVIRQGASPLVARCIKAYYWKEPYARRVLQAYRQFWTILQKEVVDKSKDWNAATTTLTFSPSAAVDAMWHQHLLDNVNYMHDSLLLSSGHYLVHNPDGDNDDNPDETASRNLRRANTRRALEKHFSKNEIDQEIWKEVFASPAPTTTTDDSYSSPFSVKAPFSFNNNKDGDSSSSSKASSAPFSFNHPYPPFRTTPHDTSSSTRRGFLGRTSAMTSSTTSATNGPLFGAVSGSTSSAFGAFGTGTSSTTAGSKSNTSTFPPARTRAPFVFGASTASGSATSAAVNPFLDSLADADAATSAASFTLYIKLLTGKTMTFTHLNANSKIIDVMREIHAKAGIPVADQRLIFRGRNLEKERTLHDYSVPSESTFHIIKRLRGC